MKITACVIVKNEEKNLSRWIQTMDIVADELIIVDTGSVDRTKYIALQSRARVFSYRWKDDFAAAKNYALSKATGDWIIFLDADEYFSSRQVQKNLIKILKNFPLKNVGVFLCPLVNIDAQGKIMGKSNIVRIFRNLPELRYQGRIHEQLYYNGTSIDEFVVLSDVEIIHTGYSEEKIEDKLKRNLQLLLLEQKSNPAKAAHYQAALADCYYGLRNYQAAIICGEKFLSAKLQAIGDAARIYKIIIASLEAIGNINNYFRQMIRMGMKKFPDDNFFKIAWERYEMSPKEIENSACVIVKNEAKNLPNWIENIKDLVDEMIVVDTGSTDNSKEIAQAAGAQVYDFQWCDDFAAAKNFAISKAKGKWIFFLDADEYFPLKCHNPLRQQMKRFSEKEALICRLINIDVYNDNKYLNSFYQMRIFRNLPSIRYISRIHEMLTKKGKEKLKAQMLSPEIYIYHTGYSDKLKRQKAERNLKILQSEIKKYGETPLRKAYLSDVYSMLDDEEKAYIYAKKAIDNNIDMLGMETKLYIKVYQGMIRHKFPSEDIEKFLDKAINRYPRLEDFYLLKAMYLKEHGKYYEAEQCLKQALKNLSNQSFRIEFSCVENPDYKIAYAMGILKKLKNDQVEAINYFSKAVKKQPHKLLPLVNLYYFLQNRSVNNRLFLLEKLLPKDDMLSIRNVKKAIVKYPLDNLYIIWLKKFKYIASNNDWRDMLIRGNYQRLQEKNIKELQNGYKELIMEIVEDWQLNRQDSYGIKIYKTVLSPIFQVVLEGIIDKLV